jgi:uncharacterized protein YkwD
VGQLIAGWGRMQAVALAAVGLLVLGCGGREAGMLRGATPATVRAPAPGAERYATHATSRPVVGPADRAAAVARGVARGAGARGQGLEGDGRLGLLAAWTAEHLGEGATPPPHAVVEFFARHLGLVEPTPHLLILGHPDSDAIESAVADSVSQFLSRHLYTHYGAVVVERQGVILTLVVLSSRFVELAPVRRELPLGEGIVLEGKLLGGHRNPKLVVQLPDGRLDRRSGGRGASVSARVDPRVPGVHRVEVLAVGPRGDAVMANFPVYVGLAAPGELALSAPEEASGARGADAVAHQLLGLLNRTRAEAGLHPLELDGALSAVAEAHSRDMVEHGFVGHTSPNTGTAPARVARAGIRTGVVLENIGRGYGAAEIHEGLMQSPGHRANLIHPDVTHVGMGVVVEDEGDRAAFVVTQVFIRTTPPMDLEQAPDRVLDLVNRARKERGLRPVRAHADLRRAAHDAARRYFADPSLAQQEVVEKATAELGHLGRTFRRVGGSMVVAHSLEEVAAVPALLDAELGHVGVGVAQGTRPDAPPNAIAIVLVLAWPR